MSMKLLLITFATVITLASATQLVGSRSKCIAGRRHTLTHNVSSDASFVDLDGDLGRDLKSVTCDMDHTRMTLNFKTQLKRDGWWLKFKTFSNHFIVGGMAWNCSTVQQKMGGAVLRRVIAPNLVGPHTFSDSFEIKTTLANYDEVFQEGNIAYGAVSDPDCAAAVGTDHPICLGWNADCESGHASQPIPLYTSPETSFAQITATCTDCYAAFESDMVFTMQFKAFKLHAFELGLRNSSINTGVIMQVAADKQSTLSLDKALDVMGGPQILFNFKVGPVPFVALYDVPVDVSADLDINAHADVTFGASSKILLGSLDISWDPVNHWQHLTPKLSFQFTPTLASTALLDVKGQAALKPTFNLAIDRVLTYNLLATPTLNAEVSGTQASKELCLDTAFTMDLTESAELKIDIDLINFHKDWTWGPKNIVSVNKVPIPHKCIHI
jgi:hypothetical protein